ncbi:MAG: hypothetical protein GX777_05000 [Fastidiosipila sp.]|nr:hypothetical protein [Fastidiosipila sp.]
MQTKNTYLLYLNHRIAHDIHDEIEEKIPNVKHCMVHVNPGTK